MKKTFNKTATLALLGGSLLLPLCAQASYYDSNDVQPTRFYPINNYEELDLLALIYGAIPPEPNIVVTPGNVRASERQRGKSVSNTIKSRFNGSAPGSTVTSSLLPLPESGMAAGDQALSGVSLWINGSMGDMEDHHQAAQFESDSRVGVLGGDKWINDRLLAGLAVSFEDTDTDTRWNSGDIETRGWTVSPYVALSFSDKLYADLSVGIGWGDIDMEWANDTAKGDTDYVRWSLQGNLTYMHTLMDDKIGLTSSLGLAWVSDHQDGYTASLLSGATQRKYNDSSFDLGTTSVNVEAAWRGFGPMFEPFMSVGYEIDFQHDLGGTTKTTALLGSDDQDNTALASAIGFRVNPSESFSAEVSASQMTNRDSVEEHLFSANLRYSF